MCDLQEDLAGAVEYGRCFLANLAACPEDRLDCVVLVEIEKYGDAWMFDGERVRLVIEETLVDTESELRW